MIKFVFVCSGFKTIKETATYKTESQSVDICTKNSKHTPSHNAKFCGECGAKVNKVTKGGESKTKKLDITDFSDLEWIADEMLSSVEMGEATISTELYDLLLDVSAFTFYNPNGEILCAIGGQGTVKDPDRFELGVKFKTFDKFCEDEGINMFDPKLLKEIEKIKGSKDAVKATEFLKGLYKNVELKVYFDY